MLLKRRTAMIRVIIDRHAKAGEDLSALLVELRVAAITHYPGYIGGETLVNTEDGSNIVVISTWRSIEDWERWAKSETRTKLYQHIKPMLQEKPKVRIFRIMATEQTVQH
jgi:heme-degrading monooxygenase HmoA